MSLRHGLKQTESWATPLMFDVGRRSAQWMGDGEFWVKPGAHFPTQ